MTISEGHNATPISVWAQLRRLMDEHPDAKIVTWHQWFSEDNDPPQELTNVIYEKKLNRIELIF